MNESELAAKVLAETLEYMARRIEAYRATLPDCDAVQAIQRLAAIDELNELARFQRAVIAKHRARPVERFDRPGDSSNPKG